MEGSWVESEGRQNVGSVLVVGGDASTPSEHCSGTLEQGTEPKDAHIGPCDELVSHPGVDLPLTSMSPPHDPKRDKVIKKTRCDSCTFEWQSEQFQFQILQTLQVVTFSYCSNSV